MKLRRYCVTVMDNWTPTEVFWTLAGALKWRRQHIAGAHLFRWSGRGWCEIDDSGQHLWTNAYTVPRVTKYLDGPDEEVMFCRDCGASRTGFTDNAGTEWRDNA